MPEFKGYSDVLEDGTQVYQLMDNINKLHSEVYQKNLVINELNHKVKALEQENNSLKFMLASRQPIIPSEINSPIMSPDTINPVYNATPSGQAIERINEKA